MAWGQAKQKEANQQLVIHQPQVRFLISIAFHCCQCVVDGAKNSCKSDIVQGKSEYVMMETAIVEEIHCIIHCSSDVEGG